MCNDDDDVINNRLINNCFRITEEKYTLNQHPPYVEKTFCISEHLICMNDVTSEIMITKNDKYT